MGMRNIVIGLVVLALLGGGAWYFMNNQKTSVPAPETQTPETSTQTQPATESATTPAKKNMVTISGNGFDPKSITVKMGEEVTWTNSDTVNHTVNSNPHPTHGLYSMLNLGAIQPGASKSAMFEKSGTYTYHDHLHPSLIGTVIVQ